MDTSKKIVLLRLLVVVGLCFGTSSLVDAAVVGPCTNCHTMHNSQGGNNFQVFLGATTNGWTAGGVLTGTTPTDVPQAGLLVSDCVGCHSSASASTIITMNGGGTVPIVWNIGGTQGVADDLAGGNFSYVVGAPGNGHNVLGISATDPVLTNAVGAPGRKGGVGCGDSCHTSLVLVPTALGATPGEGTRTTGCQGCHLKVGHHVRRSDDVVDPGPAKGAGDAYRFLSGHGTVGIVDNGVAEGQFFESTTWGKLNGAGGVNLYRGQADSPVDQTQQKDPLSIGMFCAGCHSAFHAVGVIDAMYGEDNRGDRNATPNDNPWLRHPTNVFVPNNGEFAGLTNLSVNYDTNYAIPLARTSTMLRGFAINNGDQVMCLSCHRAHGSQYPDALRWDMAAMTSHTGGSRITGCFFCHRAKSD